MRDFDTIDLGIWIDYLAYFYITDPTARTIIEAAGIDLFEPGPKGAGRDLLNDFIRGVNAKKSQTQIVAELQPILDVVERLIVRSRGAFINDPQVLGEIYRRSRERWNIEELARKILDDPGRGVELIKDFQITKSLGVESVCLDDYASIAIEEHLLKVKNKEAMIEVPGFERLSHLIGGFNPSRIGMFLAMTGFGKTNFALNLALRARLAMNVLYINMEMPYGDMINRCAVIGNNISFKDYFGARFNKDEVITMLQQNPGAFEMTNGRELSLDQITGFCRFKGRQKKLGLIIVDYDQKIALKYSKNEPEWKALQDAIKVLEEMAKDLGCYVMVLSQINRDGEISGSFRSAFSAHTVLKFERTDGDTFIKPLKNRHGTTQKSLRVKYCAESSHISELDLVDAENKIVNEHKNNRR